MGCLTHWGASVGEAFNAVSPAAVSLRGYAEAMFRWFGHEPKLKFLPFNEWKATQEPNDAGATREHIGRSPAHSIEKGRRLIGYEPRYSSLAAVQESVAWLRDNGKL
jgi:nucleoside-diphosphate-sugar epimerase